MDHGSDPMYYHSKYEQDLCWAANMKFGRRVELASPFDWWSHELCRSPWLTQVCQATKASVWWAYLFAPAAHVVLLGLHVC